MNDNKGMRILQWTIALLVLCNIGLILTIWLKPHHDGPPHGETPRDMVIRSLKFNDEQVAKYDMLIKGHQRAMWQFRQQANEYRSALFGNLKNTPNTNYTMDSLTALISGTQKQIEVVTYHHFEEVRSLCTDAQKTEFDNIIGDVIKKMNGSHHPPPGDGQGPPLDGHPPGDGPLPPPHGPQNP